MRAYGSILATGLRDAPELMTDYVHPLWLKIFDNALMMRKAKPSLSFQVCLDMWAGLGRIVGVVQGSLRLSEAQLERPEGPGRGLQGCGWYKCPLNIIANIIGARDRMMRCAGCQTVSFIPPC